MEATKDFTCCITLDFDALSSWIGSLKTNNPSAISRGQFGVVAMPRILALLDKYSVRASFAVPGHTACAYPRVVREIAQRGHELVHHGWVHENPADFDEAGERQILQNGIDALEKAAGVRPTGYRSPAWDLSTLTLDLLMEFGFEYDSSCMGHDSYPYYLRTGDNWSLDGPYEFGNTTELVEMPVSWSLDDFPPSEFVLGLNEGLKPASHVQEMWQQDFDYALANSPGGVFILTLHPQTIGRGNRMLLLERLLEHMHSSGARFETMADYVSRWRQANPKDAWLEANADISGRHAFSL